MAAGSARLGSHQARVPRTLPLLLTATLAGFLGAAPVHAWAQCVCPKCPLTNVLSTPVGVLNAPSSALSASPSTVVGVCSADTIPDGGPYVVVQWSVYAASTGSVSLLLWHLDPVSGFLACYEANPQT